MSDLTLLAVLPSQLLFMGGMVTFVLWMAKRARRKRDERWQVVAQEHGLSFTPSGMLSVPKMDRRLDDVDLIVTVIARSAGKSSIPYTVVRATCPLAVPQGLQVAREGGFDTFAKLLGGQDVELGDPVLDDKLRIKGMDAEVVRELLTQDSVRLHLDALLQAGRFSRIDGGQIILEEQGRDDVRLDEHITQAHTLARGLAQAVQAPWTRLCERWGLSLHTSGGEQTLVGEVDGLRLEASGRPRAANAAAVATVRIELPAAFAGLTVRLAERADAGAGIRLGDPVLDGLIEVQAEDEATARTLLTGPAALAADLHGKLLAVVHGRPGSRIGEGTLTLVGPYATAECVGALVEDGLALARALVAAAR